MRKKIEPTSGKRSLGFVLARLYHLLTRRQKLIFLAIIAIMIVSAILTQITPKAIGWLTDDILSKSDINFQQVIPFLILILIANVANEIIKILRRVLVEDTAVKKFQRLLP